MAANDIAARVAALKGDGVAVNELWLLRDLVARVAVAVNLPLQEAGGLVLDVLAEQSDELLLYERRPGEGFFHLLGLQRAVMPEEQRMPWHDSTASLPSERDLALQGLKLWWLYGYPDDSDAARRFERLAVLPRQASVCFGIPIPARPEVLPAVTRDEGVQPANAGTAAQELPLAHDGLMPIDRARRKLADDGFCAAVFAGMDLLRRAGHRAPTKRLTEFYDCSETHIKKCARRHRERWSTADREAANGAELTAAITGMVKHKGRP